MAERDDRVSIIERNENCAYCKAKLFSDDDVVYCPVCGAPHHRECYNSLEHCALEELHGTEREYSKLKELENTQIEPKETVNNIETDTTRCAKCGAEYPLSNQRCPKCGVPNFMHMNTAVFDFYGGVPKKSIIEDDITAEEVRKFVLTYTHRYIPKFIQLKGNKKTSWNWMAFLFPSCWLFSRKMYKGGIITGTLTLVARLLSIPIQQKLLNLGVFDNAISYTQVFKNTADVIPEIGTEFIILSVISSIITILVSIITAVSGDYLYKKHTVSSIKKIRNESQDIDADYRKKGGVNVFLFLLSYLALSYLPTILLNFI